VKAFFLLLASVVIAFSAAPTNYYANAEGKRSVALRAALHAIINAHTNVPYSSGGFDTSDALKVLDEDPGNTNNVILIYELRSEPKVNFPSIWEREHLWPNSYGLDSVEPAFSDLRNLRPIDATVNSARGNKYYDVSDTSSASYRNPAHAEAPLCSTDNNSWEPPTSVKGDIARALFYMAVCYRGDKTNEPALSLTDATNQLSTATNLMGRLRTLLRWHEEDPVDARELAREELIYSRFQHNRNPFVDRPEWVRAAFWPEMKFARNGNEVTLSYGAEYSTAILEFAFQSPTATWGPVGGNRSTNNGTVFVSFTLPPGPEAGFFRLRLP
jgi:endonuclease I